MFAAIANVIYSDKTFYNPVLGKVSCSGFSQIFSQCNKQFKKSSSPFCQQSQAVYRKCYKVQNQQQINNWIMSQFAQTKQMIEFLEKRKSQIPHKLFQNSFAIFTNKENLKKFDQFLQKQNNNPNVIKSNQFNISL